MANVNIRGLDQLIGKLKNYSADLQQEVDEEITASAVTIRDNAKRAAPTYTSRLKGAIVADTNTPLIKKIVVDVFYAPYMEFGTGKYVQVPPGLEAYAAGFKGKISRGSFEQFIKQMEAWITKKGIPIPRGQTLYSFAKWTAIKIAVNGVRPHPYLFPAFFAEEKLLIPRLKRITSFDGK